MVLDELGEPIIGANIVEKGTTNGTITDMDGNYSLTVNDLKKAVLQASFIGYNTIEESVKGRSTVEIKLSPSVVNLGEVVAIGYGTQTRKEITGSVANITEKDFNQGVTREASDLLQGKVAGLNIASGSGDVSSSPQIRLRGTSTLQNDQGPMIVIDGIPGGDMSTVAPSDIESISVLKDASSAAIYGSRSAGGVILITTKRGSGSKTQVNYDGYVALSSLANKPDLLTADEWRSYAASVGQSEQAKQFDQYGASTDWFDEISRTGFSQNHSLSLSGGSSKSNYRASVNYLKNSGVIRDNEMERFNFRFQFQQRAINDRLRIGLTGAATILDYNPTYGYNFVLAYNMLPVFPVKMSDGSWYENVGYDLGNPVHNIEANTRKNKTNSYYGVGDLQFTIIDGLDIKASLYKSRRLNEYSQYYDSTTDAGRDDGGYAYKRSQTYDKDMMEWTLNYDKTFNDVHKVNGLLGYSWEENMFSEFTAANRNFTTDMLGANKLQAGQDLRPDDVTSQKNEYRLISMFARAHYSYAERYMITATVRRDGSSKFGTNHKWGIFPSVSAAWGISQEAFMQDIDWINDLKLRAGWGVTGNQDGLKPYKTLELYGASDKYYDSGSWLTGYKIDQNANPDLKWEQTSMLNIGLDFQLFNGRLGGTVEWYDKRTKDMLYTYTVPSPPYLYREMMANVGDMKNTGIEVLLNLDAIRTKDFSWNTTLNMSHNKNEVTSLSNDNFTTTRIYAGDAWIRGSSGGTTHVVEEGRPIGQFYGWRCDGIDTDGKYILYDKTGDGQISEDDRDYIGDAQPDLIFGWTNSFRYKAIDFSFFFRGSIGNDVLNHVRMAYAQPGYLIGSNALDDPLTYQLKEVPKYCSLYIENASFVRLDNVTLGYTFNTKKLNWLDKARIYVTGQNLFVITGYKGLDPETNMGRNDGLAPGVEDREFYPKARTFTFGVNLTF
ncbi:SusC/RagA family TonB-linked outer membrane protein [Parabacteroides distasonis]|uniref:SusC/RagA family TonB-linked outer membrane protein n=2 Tax=Parabacteroides distasonis TaxID=823 RepID=UPI0039B53A15